MASEIVKPASPANAARSVNHVEPATEIGVSDGTPEASPSIDHTSTPPIKIAPKSWAELVRSQPASLRSQVPPLANGIANPVNGFALDKINSLGEALTSYNITEGKEPSKLSFLEPRGLVNTGNMCYMNSVSFLILMLTLSVNGCYRFCRYLYFVCRSMRSWRKLAAKLHIVSKAIPL